ncbi:hypothetical protein LTR17_010630 [Elasticomyces elasticus]|nr:hypothetical protein LTR17_010630 [Elasticomyces elasticus]
MACSRCRLFEDPETLPTNSLGVLNTGNLAAEVFGIVELLEEILLQLPTKDLLLSQRVCKTWQAACTSTKICKALFLEPGSIDDVVLPDLCERSGHCNSIKFFTEKIQSHYGCDINPLFLQHICGYETALNWKKIKQASKHERYRQMSLTQPPKDLQTFFHSSGSRYWFPTMQSVVSGKTIWETVRNVDEIGLRHSDNEELEIEFNGV